MAINSDFRGRLTEAAVGALRIVKSGSAAGTCILASAATDLLLGTSDELAHATGEVVDIAVGPVPKVVLGGTVAVGVWLTSDASGAAIATTITGNRVIGYAEVAGVAGDVITYHRAPGQL